MTIPRFPLERLPDPPTAPRWPVVVRGVVLVLFLGALVLAVWL